MAIWSPSYIHDEHNVTGLEQSEALHQTNDSDESEYEYEYEDEETEDFYFTLDLTTRVPDAIVPNEYSKNGKRKRRTADERREASEYKSGPATSMPQEPADGEAGLEFGELQFVGLDTREPYVKFNNEFFSCTWFTDIGTQLWISNPGVVQNPRMAGHVLDVIGSSQARLVGKPASLRRKEAILGGRDVVMNDARNTVTISDNENSDGEAFEHYYPSPKQDSAYKPGQALVVPRHRIKDPHFKAQADFMERFSALKIKRGEKDANSMPMRMPRSYVGASNQDELREAAFAKDAAMHAKTLRGSSIIRRPGFAAKDMLPPRRESTSGVSPSAQEGIPRAEQIEEGRVGGKKKPPVMNDSLKHGMRAKGGPRGGAPTREMIRFGLGLSGSVPSKKQTGPPTNAELAASQASESTGPPSNVIQPFSPSAETQLRVARLADTPSNAPPPLLNKESPDIEENEPSQESEPGLFDTEGFNFGSDPADPQPGAPSSHTQSRASATPGLENASRRASRTSQGHTPTSNAQTRASATPARTEPASTPGLDNASRRGSHTSQMITPVPDSTTTTPKPKRKRRTDAQMYEDACKEAALRGEPPPPPRQRARRRKPEEIALARAKEEHVRAEAEAAAAQDDTVEEDPAPPKKKRRAYGSKKKEVEAAGAGSAAAQDDVVEEEPAPPKKKRAPYGSKKKEAEANAAAAAAAAAAQEDGAEEGAEEGAAPPKKKRRAYGSRKKEAELQEKRDEDARRVFMTPGAVPLEMEISFDGAVELREEEQVVEGEGDNGPEEDEDDGPANDFELLQRDLEQ